VIATTHCTEAFADKAGARTASRRLRLSRRIDTTPRFCADCESWHVVSVDRRVSNVDRAVLYSIALGLRTAEIAQDLGETESQVVRRVSSLMTTFDAISRANLVLLAVWFGVIDPRPIACPVSERGVGGPAGKHVSAPVAARPGPTTSRPRTPVL
jgi:DNA-binding NarL/FixJ family response regulator